MPDISFPNEHLIDFGSDVIEFPAIVDGRRVSCSFTLEQMLRDFGTGTPATFEAEFKRLRPQIEERARQQILAKKSDD